VCNIAVMGMGVMGANLARNFAGRGHRVAIFNRTTEVARGLVERHPEAKMLLPSWLPSNARARSC
jgi:6-phosphogluconate dehydrogenase